jgi:hypothetical protein
MTKVKKFSISSQNPLSVVPLNLCKPSFIQTAELICNLTNMLPTIKKSEYSHRVKELFLDQPDFHD